MSRQALGRGLKALIPQAEAERGEEIKHIPVEAVEPNPYQPRRHFDEEGLGRNVNYLIDVITDGGKISSITINAEALEFDGIKGGSVHSCYPDYEQVAKQIRKEIAN